jgi:hypothetical protein
VLGNPAALERAQPQGRRLKLARRPLPSELVAPSCAPASSARVCAYAAVGKRGTLACGEVLARRHRDSRLRRVDDPECVPPNEVHLRSDPRRRARKARSGRSPARTAARVLPDDPPVLRRLAAAATVTGLGARAAGACSVSADEDWLRASSKEAIMPA